MLDIKNDAYLMNKPNYKNQTNVNTEVDIFGEASSDIQIENNNKNYIKDLKILSTRSN